jgi:hypothetical protein
MAFPFIAFVLSFIALWLSALTGIYFRKRRGTVGDDSREDLGRLLGATLTLLGLIVGFSFSMAVAQYHQRINSEEAEANAIGTEYERAGLLPAADAARVRQLLSTYLDQRISFYTPPNSRRLNQIDATSARLQASIWSIVEAAAAQTPTPVITTAVSGANEVSNSQRSTQAAWANRIPVAAWALLETIAIFSNFLFGYVALSNRMTSKRFLVLPLIVSFAFFFIADMDHPRDGVIQVVPHNLVSLSSCIRSR